MKLYIEQAILALMIVTGSVSLAVAEAEIAIHDGAGHQGHGHHNVGVALVVTSSERFDPLVQRLMAKHQLAQHPVIDEPKFLVIPHEGDAELTEMQIRYLEKLLDKVDGTEE
ncbi:MAG: hypothetical protein V7739_08315 [Motiliproteus sp.]